MPHRTRENKQVLPRFAASAIAEGVAVRGSASQAEFVLPVATSGQRHQGVSIATAASPGDGLGVQTEGVVIMRACASVGPNSPVMVGSTNGRVAPHIGASGVDVYAIGETQAAAVDADYVSVLLFPAPPYDFVPTQA
jgi:hypothetical protein